MICEDKLKDRNKKYLIIFVNFISVDIGKGEDRLRSEHRV